MEKILRKLVKRVVHAVSDIFGLHSFFRHAVLKRMSKELKHTIRKNSSFNGAELHALQTFRQVKYVSSRLQLRTDGHILEVGGYPHPGLALIFLLRGTQKYYLNNIIPVDNRLPLSYAENIFAMLETSLSNKRDLFDVVQPIEDTDDVRIKPELLEIISPVDASLIDYPENTFDCIFSVTVLEHIMNMEPTLRNIYRLLKKDGWSYHFIDMRDHSNFDKPLEFLKYSDEEFEKIQKYSNRLRRSEYLKGFEEAGFIVAYEDLMGPLPVLPKGETDFYYMLTTPIDKIGRTDVSNFDIWVDEGLRSSLHKRFHSYSLVDLSITSMNICVKKPA